MTIFSIMEQKGPVIALRHYYSFKEMCKVEKFDTNKLTKDMLPFKIGDRTVMEGEVNTNIKL